MSRKKSDAHFDQFQDELWSERCLLSLWHIREGKIYFKVDQDQLVGGLVYKAQPFFVAAQSSRRAITMSCYLVLAAVATAVLSYPTGTYQTHHIVRYQNYQYPNNVTFNVSDYSQYLGDCIAPGFSYSPILPSSLMIHQAPQIVTVHQTTVEGRGMKLFSACSTSETGHGMWVEQVGVSLSFFGASVLIAYSAFNL